MEKIQAISIVVGFILGIIAAFIKDRIDLGARKRECICALNLFTESLVMAISRGIKNDKSVIQLDDIAKRLFAARYDGSDNWKNFILINEVYMIWLNGGYINDGGCENDCEKLKSASREIIQVLQ